MSQDLVDTAIDLMRGRDWEQALVLLRQAIDDDPTIWGRWYMAGQCCRFTNDLEGAVRYLSHAVELQPDVPQVFHALGIAFQLQGRFSQAIEAFGRAIEIDPEAELAYNSLALTQKLAGDLEKAVHNYDAGLKALARGIVKSMSNNRSNPILKHRDTSGQRWTEQALYGAIWLVSLVPEIESLAWPTGESAAEEERTELHGGLYWEDRNNTQNKRVRLFFPNYFNTFREGLRLNRSYSDLLGNWGTVLQLLGKEDEAQQHFQEATEFLPRDGRGTPS
jgi:tetratricopeptide (TPR) repeat protein